MVLCHGPGGLPRAVQEGIMDKIKGGIGKIFYVKNSAVAFMSTASKLWFCAIKLMCVTTFAILAVCYQKRSIINARVA